MGQHVARFVTAPALMCEGADYPPTDYTANSAQSLQYRVETNSWQSIVLGSDINADIPEVFRIENVNWGFGRTVDVNIIAG